MTIEEIEAYLLTQFERVHRETNYGYVFFFVGEDRRLPFVTLATEDAEYDNRSNLSRPGVYRINIGVRKETFQGMFPDFAAGGPEPDYTELDRFQPHPDYAAQFWVCILSPSPASVPDVKNLIGEAYEMSKSRDAKLSARAESKPGE